MEGTFSSPELPDLINLLLRPGQSFWETRSTGLCIPQASLSLASCISVREKSIYLCFGIGEGRRLGKREEIKFPKSPSCQQLPGAHHRQKPTTCCWRWLGCAWVGTEALSGDARMQFSPPPLRRQVFLPCSRAVFAQGSCHSFLGLLGVADITLLSSLSLVPSLLAGFRCFLKGKKNNTRFSSCLHFFYPFDLWIVMFLTSLPLQATEPSSLLYLEIKYSEWHMETGQEFVLKYAGSRCALKAGPAQAVEMCSAVPWWTFVLKQKSPFPLCPAFVCFQAHLHCCALSHSGVALRPGETSTRLFCLPTHPCLTAAGVMLHEATDPSSGGQTAPSKRPESSRMLARPISVNRAYLSF